MISVKLMIVLTVGLTKIMWNYFCTSMCEWQHFNPYWNIKIPQFLEPYLTNNTPVSERAILCLFIRMDISTRIFYMGLLSPAGLVHSPNWRHSKTLHL